MSHVAEGATLAAQGGDQEACQVGQSPDKASLLREVSVEDTVVDDVILKPNALIDVLLIDKENWDLFQWVKIENKVIFPVNKIVTNLLWCL